MALNSCCSRQIDCALCPKTSQGVLIYSQYPKGQHFPAEKCTQNCIIFILKGELLVNSEEYPGTTLQARQCILQAIGSKVELLALTDVEYFTYRFTELPLLCEERYKDILERAYAPLTYTPLPIIPKLERLFGDLTEYFREQPNTCSRYLDVEMPGDNLYPDLLLPNPASLHFFLSNQYIYGKFPLFRHAELR